MPLDDLAVRVPQICAEHAGLEGPLLPILHAVMAEFGHIPEAAIAPIASALNISRADVHGVVSFYHDFREEPAGRLVIKVCASEACQAVGGFGLLADLKAKLLSGGGTTTPDGSLTIEPVYCLGLCACGPAAMIGDRLHGRLDMAGLDVAIAAARDAPTPATGPAGAP